MYRKNRAVIDIVCCGIATLVLAGCGARYSEERKAAHSDNAAPAPSSQANVDPVERDYAGTGTGYSPAIGDTFVENPAARSDEKYGRIYENDYFNARTNPLSTFSIDADGASYANVRRFISRGEMPPPDAVRIEELINYFSYDYPEPRDGHPLSVVSEVAACPWNEAHRLVRIGIGAANLLSQFDAPNNIVFLIDVSGSMSDPAKLPLLKNGLNMLVEELGSNDRVAIVTYAGSASVALASTPGNNRREILSAIRNLEAGGSTAGEAGINLAYDIASRNFISDGKNHVILATDGDFNAGASSANELRRLIEVKRSSGISLSVIGLGEGDINDETMEQMADNGNGTYYYIDSRDEAERVMRHNIPAGINVAARDVKIQVEFNPATVKEYRLIGYENRALAARDFNDDVKDGGEIASGQDVTALYEIVPATSASARPKVDRLKYQPSVSAEPGRPRPAASSELMTVKVRYKRNLNDTSTSIIQPVIDRGNSYTTASGSMKLAAAVAEWGLLLRDSKYKGNATLAQVLALAESGLGNDADGSRGRFIALVRNSMGLLDRRPI